VNEEVELTQALIRNACVNEGRDPVSEIPNADVVLATLEGSGFDIEVFDAAPAGGPRYVLCNPALLGPGLTQSEPDNK
jgi:hypothetical protein